MSFLLALGYMISSLFGIGVLLLPGLVQQVGVGCFLLVMTAVAVLLNLAAYVVLELVQITGSDVQTAVKSFLGSLGNLVPAFLGVFTYSALTAYMISAGDQLSAFFGGDPHYWSSLFFVLALIPAVKGLAFAAGTSVYLSFLLISVLMFLIPHNLSFSEFVPPVFGSIAAVPLLVLISTFALAGHFAIYQVHKLVRDEKKDILVFFISFAFAYLVYLAFGITSSAVSPNLSGLSTVGLASVYPPVYSLLISAAAVLAFFMAFITVAHSFVKTFEGYVSPKGVYPVLLIPIAILYVLVREFKVFSLLTLVGKFGGVSFLLFLSLACAAHFNASKNWKVKFPPFASAFLSVTFLVLAITGLVL